QPRQEYVPGVPGGSPEVIGWGVSRSSCPWPVARGPWPVSRGLGVWQAARSLPARAALSAWSVPILVRDRRTTWLLLSPSQLDACQSSGADCGVPAGQVASAAAGMAVTHGDGFGAGGLRAWLVAGGPGARRLADGVWGCASGRAGPARTGRPCVVIKRVVPGAARGGTGPDIA